MAQIFRNAEGQNFRNLQRTSRPPQNRRKTGGQKLRNGLDLAIGKKRQFQPCAPKTAKTGAKTRKALTPQKRRGTGVKKLNGGLDPAIGKKTQFQPKRWRARHENAKIATASEQAENRQPEAAQRARSRHRKEDLNFKPGDLRAQIFPVSQAQAILSFSVIGSDKKRWSSRSNFRLSGANVSSLLEVDGTFCSELFFRCRFCFSE